jgi:DNA-binding transcriptional LysR family regulator
VNFASLDLNLLVALDALLEQRSVTRAAEQLGLSQPALSASLARLRRYFGDDLLIRVGNQYRLTPLALQVRERTRVALTEVERVFTAQPEFDPATSRREFSVLMSDYGVSLLGIEAASILAREAPGVRLRMVANSEQSVDQAARVLTKTDLMVIPHGFIDDLPHQDLCRDEWACVVSADNPNVGDSISVEQLRLMPWVFSYHGPTASTTAALQMRMLGIEPYVQVVTGTFLTVPQLVSGTGRVALLQRRLIDLLPADSGLKALACPFEAGSLVEAMWWHPMNTADPEHTYLRGVMARAAQRYSSD